MKDDVPLPDIDIYIQDPYIGVRRLVCNHCPRSIKSSEEAARYRGWRIFLGKSLTGKDLDVVLCPVHAGREDEQSLPLPIPTWVVHCTTCDWSSDEDDLPGDPIIPILTAFEARQVAAEHKCEPEFRFTDPSGKSYPSSHPEFQHEVKETSPKPRTKE